MQQWLAARLALLSRQTGQRLCVIGPRGGAKSTWGSLLYVLYAAVHKLQTYIWIISDTETQAVQHLENVRIEIETNEVLREAFPELSASVLRQTRLTLGNGVVIEALGTGQKVRGRRRGATRPQLIIVDDPENDESANSPGQRATNWRWFTSALMKAGDASTNFVVLGSALQRDCLTMRLMKTPGWEGRIFRAIEQWPADMGLWSQWEQVFTDVQAGDNEAKARMFYDQRKAAMDAGAVMNWPSYHDLYAMMCARATDGHAAFECEMQGNPINPENVEWPEEYLSDSHIWFDDWPAADYELRIISLDPSKGKDAKRGDYSAYILLQQQRNGLIYVDADLKRRHAADIVSDGFEHHRLFRPQALAVETNQFQELLADEFHRQALERGVTMPLWCIHNSIKKEVRIRALTTLLSRRLLRFKRGSPGAALLVDQMRDFPLGDHDDGPDALEQAVRMIDVIANGVQSDGIGAYLPLDV